jgi:AcrR family transcriptional regulator
MSKSGNGASALDTGSTRASSLNGDSATRDRVVAAAITCILERGYYRASTNEIARTAGVTWGVIQHYFGTREGLMLAVLQDGASKFVAIVEDVQIAGDTTTERMNQLIDIFSSHYASPAFLAYLQILLNMDRDPRTSTEIRKTMLGVAEQSHGHVLRLLREALGPAAGVPDLVTTIFLVIRGFGLSEQLLDTMAYDSLAPKQDRIARQRRLLASVLAPYVQQAQAERS